MSEYQQRARDFCEKHDLKIEIKYLGLDTPLWDNEQHQCYKVTIKGWPNDKLQKFVMRWYDSLLTTRENEAKEFVEDWETPTEYDILCCLPKNPVGRLNDFCEEFDIYPIEKDVEHVIEVWKEERRLYREFSKCFPMGKIPDEFQEIN
jgi:hypothetical protein